MNTSNDTASSGSGGLLTAVFGIVGVIATAVVGGIAALHMTSDASKDCVARGYSTILCAVGTVGLVDLGDLTAKDATIATLTRRAGEQEAEVAAAKTAAEAAATRLKEAEAAVAQAKAAAGEVERLRAEVTKRDAKIQELADKLTAAAKATAPAVPTARPAVPVPAPAPQKPKG